MSENSIYDTGTNTYELDGETYANCGNCDIRAICGGFGATIFPVIKLALEENETPEEALVTVTARRDETHDYGDGGAVSYIQAVVDGKIDPDKEDADSDVDPFRLLFGGLLDDDDDDGWDD